MTKPNLTPSCRGCGNPFRKNRKREVYCCDACALHPRLSKDGNGGCWLWTGAKNDMGYGQLTINGKRHYAHRLSFVLVNRPITGGLYICHKCDTPLCCNPDHMFLGTQAENSLDMAAKGRAATPLTANDILAIRALRGRISHAKIAPLFGVSESAISAIMSRQNWKHVP